MRKPHFTGLFQRRNDGKPFTLRELLLGENNQQSTQNTIQKNKKERQMNTQKNMSVGLDGIEPVDHRALFGNMPKTSWPMPKITMTDWLLVIALVLIVSGLGIAFYQTVVKSRDKADDKFGNIEHHDRVVFVQPN